MKDYKWGKFFKILIISIILGGIFGFIVGIASVKFNFASINDSFANLIFFPIICGISGIVMQIYCNIKVKKDNYQDYEGSVFEKIGVYRQIALFLCTSCAVLNITCFGFVINASSPMYWGLFMTNITLAFIGEVMCIALVKKVQPQKNADPMDINFTNDYLKTLDELEQKIEGESSAKTIASLAKIFGVIFIVFTLTTFAEITSTDTFFAFGISWFIIILVYNINSYKISKKYK